MFSYMMCGVYLSSSNRGAQQGISQLAHLIGTNKHSESNTTARKKY